MNNVNNINKQQGNVLLSSLLILVSIAMLGTGLFKDTVRETSLANFKTVDSEVFQITETCAHDVITWFETQTATPSTVDDITVSDLSFMLTGSESTTESNKLLGYSYGCTTTYITSKNVAVGEGVGSEIGGAGGEYGSTGGEVLKDFYQIVATGSGPNSASKVVNTVVSVAY